MEWVISVIFQIQISMEFSYGEKIDLGYNEGTISIFGKKFLSVSKKLLLRYFI